MKSGFLGKNLAIFLLLLFVSLVLFFFDQQGWISPVRGAVEQPVLTIEEKIHSLNIFISSYFNIFSYWRSGQKELMRLQAKVQKLAVDQNQLSSCLEENERMRRLLGVPLPPQWKFLPAKVVGVTQELRLDNGKRDGVEEGMMIVSENILVGKVIAVHEFSSLVQLPNDPNSKIPVVIKRPNSTGIQARGLLLGQYGGRLILDRVLQNEDIQKDDLILTNGEGDWLIDLLIGQIEEVLPKTAEVYQQAVVSPLVDYQSLRIVFVVLR